jgi:four helix bundle protein
MTKLQDPEGKTRTNDQITNSKVEKTNNYNSSRVTKRNFDLEYRTLEFAKAVIKFCKRLPSNVINKQIIAQLIRSSGSVGANYCEANDSLSKKDFNHRIKITRKEAKETCYWLQLIVEANPDFKNDIDRLFEEAVELKKIFSTIANKVSGGNTTR